MIPALNVVKVAMRWSVEGLEAFNIINVLCPGPADAADLTAIAAVFQAWWNTELRPATSGAVSWAGADLTALDGPGAPFLAYINTGTSLGGQAGGNYPPNVSCAISFRTGLSGRSYRGRSYVAGLTVGLIVTGGLMSAGGASYLQSAWDPIRTRLVAAGYQLCVLSLYSGMTVGHEKIPRASGVATPVTSIVVGRRVDTQRRRLPVEGRA